MVPSPLIKFYEPQLTILNQESAIKLSSCYQLAFIDQPWSHESPSLVLIRFMGFFDGSHGGPCGLYSSPAQRPGNGKGNKGNKGGKGQKGAGKGGKGKGAQMVYRSSRPAWCRSWASCGSNLDGWCGFSLVNTGEWWYSLIMVNNG